MNYMAKFIAIAGFAALTACGGADTPAENVEEQADVQADAIENQAEMVDDQTDMAANEMGEDALENQADALENRADAVRESGERSEEQTSELQSLMRNSYAVFLLKTKKSAYQKR